MVKNMVFNKSKFWILPAVCTQYSTVANCFRCTQPDNLQQNDELHRQCSFWTYQNRVWSKNTKRARDTDNEKEPYLAFLKWKVGWKSDDKNTMDIKNNVQRNYPGLSDTMLGPQTWWEVITESVWAQSFCEELFQATIPGDRHHSHKYNSRCKHFHMSTQNSTNTSSPLQKQHKQTTPT